MLLTGIIEKNFAFNNNPKDSLIANNKNSNFSFEDEIIKDAKDSINIDLKNKKIFLYGNAKILYKDIKIEAGFIEIDWNTNLITAKPKLDTLGKKIQIPFFKEGEESFNAEEIKYNLKSKKGIIKQIKAKEGEGFILGDKVKKTENDILYLKNGDFTTCDHDKPHFSIRSKKIKVIPGEKIITGPAYLRLFNFPTPLALPFGYFPNNQKRVLD